MFCVPKARLRRSAAAARASRRGTLDQTRVEHAHAVFAKPWPSNAVISLRAAEARACSRGPWQKSSFANAHAVFPISCGGKDLHFLRACAAIADSRGPAGDT